MRRLLLRKRQNDISERKSKRFFVATRLMTTQYHSIVNNNMKNITVNTAYELPDGIPNFVLWAIYSDHLNYVWPWRTYIQCVCSRQQHATSFGQHGCIATVCWLPRSDSEITPWRIRLLFIVLFLLRKSSVLRNYLLCFNAFLLNISMRTNFFSWRNMSCRN